MPDLILPIGNHFFTAEALQKAVASAVADHPGKLNVLKGTVDQSGANVVLVLGAADNRWTIQTAIQHDWTGDTRFGAGGSIAW